MKARTSSFRSTPGVMPRAVVIGLLGLVALVDSTQAQFNPDWTRHFRVGALTGFNIKGDFKMDGMFSVSGNNAGATGVSGVNHRYDDGYVLVDDTGNAQQWTSYWGYDSASQYDAATHQLFMHSSSSFSATGSGSAQDDVALGVELAYGGELKRWGRTSLGWELGFGFLPIGLKDHGAMPATVNRSTYAFDTGGIVLPTAPYQGGPGGVGPTIHDVATLVGSDTVSGTLTGSRKLDVTLYSLRLGPTLSVNLSPRFSVAGGLGPAVGLATETYKYDEAIAFTDGTSAHNRGSFDATDVVYGGYVNVTAVYHAEENGDIFLGVQYMPMSASTITGPGRSAKLDLQGQVYVTLGVNWPF